MDKGKTVSFSGYRPEKFSFILMDNQEAYLHLESRIRSEIIKAALDGYDTLLCGMARGFDLVCGNIAIQLKQDLVEWSNLRLIAVQPYRSHDFSGPWGIMHSLVMSRADKVVYSAEKYSRQVFHVRNRYLVDHSSRLICYYDGQAGGTDYTVKYAKNKGLQIINLR